MGEHVEGDGYAEISSITCATSAAEGGRGRGAACEGDNQGEASSMVWDAQHSRFDRIAACMLDAEQQQEQLTCQDALPCPSSPMPLMPARGRAAGQPACALQPATTSSSSEVHGWQGRTPLAIDHDCMHRMHVCC